MPSDSAPLSLFSGLRPPRLYSRAAAVFVILFGVYSLTFSGGLHSTDEMSMVAATESLAKFGRPTTNQLLWMAPNAWSSDTYGADGQLYSKKGPAQSVLALPLYWLALHVPGLGLVETTMLLNALVTAATGALLFAFVVRLGYAWPVGVAVALAYGLGTMAWVYARFFFSEPAAGLFLLAAAYALAVGKERREWRWWLALASGVCVGLAAATRYAEAAVAPVLLGYLLLRPSLSPGEREGRKLAEVLAFAIGLGVVAAMLGVYNWWRFGGVLATGYQGYEMFTAEHFAEAVFGFIVSPDHSVFVYSPLLLLAAAALLWRGQFWRRHRPEAVMVVGVVGVHVVVYAAWYQWWGGSCWGPRFLLPALPLLALALAPPLQGMAAARPRWPAWGGLAALVGVSVAVQLIGLAVDFNLTPQLDDSVSPVVRSLAQWPVATHLWLMAESRWDIAWLQAGRGDIGLIVAVGGIGLIGVAALCLFDGRRRGRIVALAAPASVGIVVVALALAPSLQPKSQQNLGRALTSIAVQAGAGDALVTNLPLNVAWMLDQNKTRLPTYGLAKDSLDDDPQAAALLEKLLQERRRLWFAVEWTAAADPASGVERWLTERAYLGRTAWFGDDVRVSELLTAGPAPAVEREAEVVFGDIIRLDGYRIEGQLNESSLRPSDDGSTVRMAAGESLRVGLRWRALAPVAQRYKVFLHVTDGDTIVAQADREPAGGFRPTTSWRVGETVSDNYAITLPPSTGAYWLMVGLYGAEPSGEGRLPTSGGLSRGDDAVALARLEVGGH